MFLRVPALYVNIGPCNLSTKAKTRRTVLKPIKVICRHYICSFLLRDRPRDVH